jgi:DnaJ-class molecular chaperone
MSKSGKYFAVPEGHQMGRQMTPKIRELTCPACKGTGFPVVMQPVQPGRKIYPVKCKSCDGKGKITESN